ncbi:hypothetical protein ACE1SV_76890 [Streptomyces sennicomposti]
MSGASSGSRIRDTATCEPSSPEAELRKKLREAREQAAQTRGKLDALATVTANLYAENLTLKKRLGRKGIAVLPAPEREPSHPPCPDEA